MINKTAVINQLQQLIDGVEAIINKPRFGSDFTIWYKKAVTIIEDNFGKESEEIKEFQSIKFEPPEALLPEVLLESIRTAQEDIEILNNRKQRYYEERLSELRELLLAMILKLRR